VRLSEESYNAIKIQLLALGYAELVDDEKSAKRKAVWTLTKSGFRQMYQAHAQPAEQETKKAHSSEVTFPPRIVPLQT